MAGTSLDGKGVADTVAILASVLDLRRRQAILRRHEERRPTTPTSGTRSIKNFEQHGIIPTGKVDARRRRVGRPDLAARWSIIATKTDELVKKLDGAHARRRQEGAARQGQDLLRRLRLPRLVPSGGGLVLTAAMAPCAGASAATPTSAAAIARGAGAASRARSAAARSALLLFVAHLAGGLGVDASPIILPSPWSVVRRAARRLSGPRPRSPITASSNPSLYGNLALHQPRTSSSP